MRQDKARWAFSDTEQDKWLDGPFVVIADKGYYADNKAEILGWLKDSTPHWRIEGAVITFSRKEHQILFKLRWDDQIT